MGLDMYLSADDDSEVIGYWRKANAIHGWFVNECADGVDECQEIPVSREQLERLLAVTREVLASCVLVPGRIQDAVSYERDAVTGEMVTKTVEREGLVVADTTAAEELLPPMPGFFFGGYDYDSWYVGDLTDTESILEAALEAHSGGFVYQASW